MRCKHSCTPLLRNQEIIKKEKAIGVQAICIYYFVLTINECA